MACPICGANCRCRNRGPGGLCCSCHRHKVKGKSLERDSPEMKKWKEDHGYSSAPKLIEEPSQ